MNRLALSLYAAFMMALWSGLAAATIGMFRPVFLLPVAVISGMIVFRLNREDDVGLDGWACVAMSISLVAMMLSWPPGHVMQLQWDPAVYIQSGVVIAREGGIAFDLPVFHELPRIIRDLVSYPSVPGSPFSGMVFDAEGRVIPIFRHLFPVWIAWCYSLGGLDAALAANIPLMGLSGVLMFLLARRWFGTSWGLLASFILCFFPIQWWQARFPTAELLAQALLLGGFVFLQGSFDHPRGRMLRAGMAGMSFGLAMLARFDSILLVVPVVVLLAGAWNVVSWRSVILAVVIPVMVLSLQAFWNSWWMGSPYFPRQSLIIAGLLMTAAAFLFQRIVARRNRSEEVYWTKLAKPVSLSLAVMWLAYMFINWKIRPHFMSFLLLSEWFQPVQHFITTTSFGRVWTGHDAWNTAILEAVSGWPMVLAAIIGVGILLLNQDGYPVRRLWLLSSVPAMCILLFSLHHERDMMWLCRRFVPVVVPLLVVSSVAALHHVFHLPLFRLPARRFFLAVSLLAVLFGLRRPVEQVWSIREFFGTKPGFAALAGHVPPQSLVFADITGFGAVLRTVFGCDALELYGPTVERREILMQWLPALVTDRDVLFLTPIPVSDIVSGHYELVNQEILAARIYEQPDRSPPESFVDLSSPFRLYRVIPYDSTKAAPR